MFQLCYKYTKPAFEEFIKNPIHLALLLIFILLKLLKKVEGKHSKSPYILEDKSYQFLLEEIVFFTNLNNEERLSKMKDVPRSDVNKKICKFNSKMLKTLYLSLEIE